ncbi:MAG: group III truncated hemoglobin [Phaeodactylibacter sp.]|nr:group III truncated hemoglobin [Phaeodactylibacter sp.]
MLQGKLVRVVNFCTFIPMPDIHDRKDVVYLVDQFYKQVVVDEEIGVFFTEVVQLTWEKHMPVMYDFWESTLFGKALYKGNPMLKHIDLHGKMALTKAHFERWLSLWTATVQQHFEGPNAEAALSKAQQIAALMQYKIEQHPFFP